MEPKCVKLVPALILCLLLFLPISVCAQAAPYLIPQTVYVGDWGVLVVPLGVGVGTFQSTAVPQPSIEEPQPDSKDLVIHRVSLERAGDTARLLVEFTAYRPGSHELPAISVSGFSDFDALTITVASILDADGSSPSSMALSEPADPLLAPGTMTLIYGSVTATIFALILGIGLRLFWRSGFKNLRRSLLRLFLTAKINVIIVSLRKRLDSGAENGGAVLDTLAREFRRFLTKWTGTDCLAMSAGEFARLDLGTGELSPLAESALAVQLASMFREWDALRFNDEGVSALSVRAALDDVRRFVSALRIVRTPSANGDERLSGTVSRHF